MSALRLHLDLHQNTPLVLSSAVLIYHAPNTQERNAYASIHPVVIEQGQPRLLAGKPLLPRAALTLARELAPAIQMSGYLPENVLYAQADLLAWWRPARPCHIAFDGNHDTIGVRGGVVPHPPLVFCIGSGGWRVYALRGNERPLPETALYQAPYFNVSPDGLICRGSARVPDRIGLEHLAAWEDAFFRSQFTQPNAAKLIQYKRGAHAFWRAMLDGRYATFPSHLLVPLQRTLAQQIARTTVTRSTP